MIKGRGLLAMALESIDADEYLFYANGISNSVLSQISANNFEIKEIREIAQSNTDRTFVYFSTSQVNSKVNHTRPYVKHKLFIEELIIDLFPKYVIIRTSNLVGNNPWNTHTLFNFLYNSLTLSQQIILNPGLRRNFLDTAHFTLLLKAYLENYPINKVIEIVNPASFTMAEIISEFERYFSKKFIVTSVWETNDFALFELNTQLSTELFAKCPISTNDYIQCLLKKYYRVDTFIKRTVK